MKKRSSAKISSLRILLAWKSATRLSIKSSILFGLLDWPQLAKRLSGMAELKYLPRCQLVTGSGLRFGTSHIGFSTCWSANISRMMPQDSVYGVWPRSGEIDIAESRGNDPEHYALGNNIIGSALHWGPSYDTDMIDKTKGVFQAKRTKYSDGVHTYGLEWSEKYIFMWLDGRLRVSQIRLQHHSNLTMSTSKYSFSISPPLEVCGNSVTSTRSSSMEQHPKIRGTSLGIQMRRLIRTSTLFWMLQWGLRTATFREFPNCLIASFLSSRLNWLITGTAWVINLGLTKVRMRWRISGRQIVLG
jgi:hypothetical protein